MRFQTSETVQVSDPERVLRVLETCLQNISPEVVRRGDEITLRGLGPSPRSVNPHDKTVLRVTAKRDQIVIDADVNFQASAFLGEMPQDEVVRSKLNQVFLQMRSQLDGDALFASALDAKSSAAPSSQADVEPVEAGDVRPENPAFPIAHETPLEPVPEPKVEPKEYSPRGPEQISLVHKEGYRETKDVKPDRGGRVGWWMTGWIVLLLIVGGSYLYFWHHGEVATSFHRLIEPPTVVVAPEPSNADIVAPVNDEVHVAPPPHAQSPVPAKAIDPKVWLQDWASAMRTKDPAAQAAFYAIRVDNYLGKHNVSRDTVLRDREATIRIRKGIWTMKMENVVVLRQTDSEAVIRLIKHFIDEPAPSEVLEWFVPSELILKRTNEGWKISSEKDLGSSTPASGDLRSLQRSGK